MTDQLEGPELALAVAKVLGKNVKISAGACIYKTEHTAGVYTPDLGGDAGAEVLDWLAERSASSSIAIIPPCKEDPLWTVLVFAHEIEAPTMWIALCRAVVEVGK